MGQPHRPQGRMQEAEICFMGHTEDSKHRGLHGELKWAWSNEFFFAYVEGRNASFIGYMYSIINIY